MTTEMTKHENGQAQAENRAWATALLDVYEGKDEYLVFADVPGVKEDGIQIELKEGQMRIEAKRDSIDFRRVLTVGPDVDVEKISATVKDGVLEIHMPKAAAAKPRTIAVRKA